MARQDEVALWLATATLKADGQEIAALDTEGLMADIEAGKDLDTSLEEMRRFDRKGGDFGAEIIGPLLIPIVVEAAKQLWATYLKELTEQGGKQLAILTIDAVKAAVGRLWSDKPDLPTRYAALIRAEAERQGLAADQVERLVQTVKSPLLTEEITAP
ncbi:hypothetical protein [Xanthobacter autotrophicus]|uniref:hypothetical protein n=1 Tax=Xanthobacter autotrophicus TaxID=280 RepID=UPI0024A75361|nr:hypothetical protein [Xanthobacter autotrophicus]MDI4657526.1 hypothetical protein [Xanthobacter autotrophicus]